MMKFEQTHASPINSELVGLLRDKSRKSKASEERLEWLRSQLIGGDVEFSTPFGKRVLTYADQTASGQCLQYIENYIVQKVLPFYGNTHTSDSFVGSKTTKMAHKASEYIKSCMGGGSDDALIFCGSGTTAAIKRLQEVMGIAVNPVMRDRMLETLNDEERWVVFIGPYEHHSNILSWRQSSAEVVEIGVNDEGLIDMEELERELTSPKYADRPKLGSFSACSNVSGILTDTRALARLLHKHGAFACFDFAASGPYVEIDMRSGTRDGYDAVFLSPHKFVGGPGTPGILLMNKALYRLRSLPPSTCGGGTVEYVNGFSERDTLYYEDIEEREDAGTPAIIQKIRASLAFWVKEYIGYSLIDLHESFYVDTALKRLLANPNIQVLGNTGVKRLPIVSFLVFPPSKSYSNGLDDKPSFNSEGNVRRERNERRGMPLHGRFVATLLNDLFGVQARGGCACAGPYGHHLLAVDEALSIDIRAVIEKGYNGLKPGWTRLSFSYYISKEEFAFVLACIEFVAQYGHRFLPLYLFDWETGDWTFQKRAYKYHLMTEELALASSDLAPSKNGARGERAGNVVTWKPRSSDKDPRKEDNRFASYLESAKRIALSLPEDPRPATIPDDIVGFPILFRI